MPLSTAETHGYVVFEVFLQYLDNKWPQTALYSIPFLVAGDMARIYLLCVLLFSLICLSVNGQR